MNMKYLIFVLVVVLLLISGFDFKYDPTYTVNITVYTHGTHKLWSYSLNNEIVKVIKYSTNNEKPKTLLDRKLTKAEQKEIDKIMKKFPLKKMKTRYENKLVEGEIHSIYKININGLEKEIYVYFYKEKNLDKLMVMILKLMANKN